MNRSFALYCCGLLLVLCVSSCSNTKQLADNQALLVKNNVEVESNQKILKKRELRNSLSEIVLQKPNKKFLGLGRLKLWIFTIANRKRENKFRWWLKNKVGEPPVIHDDEMRLRSADLMRNYLSNNGYFYNEVESSVDIENKKARVLYEVVPNEVFRFDSLSYTAPDYRMREIMESEISESHVEDGQPFETQKLKSERERISNLMQNQGYFYFNKEYVTFLLDSTGANYEMDVEVIVSSPTDTTAQEIYWIDKVYVYSDYSLQQELKDPDTTYYQDLVIISDEFMIKPKVLRDIIYMRKDRFYRKQDYTLTVQRLNSLGIFKFVNIKFVEKRESGRRLLDVFVYMTPAKKQSLTINLEANSNFEGLLGTGISITYGNKNPFKVADLLKFAISTGIELEFNPDVPLVNTADFSPEINYYLNRFIVPFRLKKVSRNANPKTRFSLGYKFQKRVRFYNLQTLNLSFGYEWNETVNKRHILNPFNISFLNTSNETEEFLIRLEEDPLLRSSFENLLILNSTYSYIVTSKNPHAKNFLFFRGNLDIGGNLLHGIMSLAMVRSDDEKPYTLLGREYSQYSKIEGDFRLYRDIGKNSSLVFRLNAGVGLAYGNSRVLPYVKQFYAGGANSLRAFNVRSVGPGTLSDTASQFFGDQTGDMIIETNIEYRFGIFKWLKGAFFIDAGNIWLIDNKTRTQGNFSSSFYKEYALGAGAGIRFDFQFFVVRFDWAIPLRDPARPENNRWLFQDLQFKQFNFNLAIGYPF